MTCFSNLVIYLLRAISTRDHTTTLSLKNKNKIKYPLFCLFSVMLPRLTAMALENNNQTNDVKKKEMALQLFEAYSALSCCCILYLCHSFKAHYVLDFKRFSFVCLVFLMFKKFLVVLYFCVICDAIYKDH
jgi:hypothetical protein